MTSDLPLKIVNNTSSPGLVISLPFIFCSLNLSLENVQTELSEALSEVVSVYLIYMHLINHVLLTVDLEGPDVRLVHKITS